MTHQLQAGFGRVDITPLYDIPNGMWRAQRHIRGEGIDLPLAVGALFLTDGVQKVVLLDLDLCILDVRLNKAIRAAVAQQTGIPTEQVWPFVTHSHAGPTTTYSYEGEGADLVHAYASSLPTACARAAAIAMDNLKPARIAVGHGACRIGINRDLRMPDGRIVVGPNPSGFMDPEVIVVRIDDLDGNPLVCVVNYACHPTVLGPENKLVSPDYPGATKRTVESLTKAPCFFLQGAAGNVGPIKTFVKDAKESHRLGDILGCEAARIFLELETRPVEEVLDHVLESGAPLAIMQDKPVPETPPLFRVLSRTAHLPYSRPLPPLYANAPDEEAQWEAIHTDLQKQNAPLLEINQAFQCLTRARLRHDRARRYSQFDSQSTELQGLRIGDFALIASWGEPYAELGVAIKKKSPFKHTLFAGYLGEEAMYIATADAYTTPPPMEVANSPFKPEAASTLITEALALAQSLSDVQR